MVCRLETETRISDVINVIFDPHCDVLNNMVKIYSLTSFIIYSFQLNEFTYTEKCSLVFYDINLFCFFIQICFTRNKDLHASAYKWITEEVVYLFSGLTFER